MRDRSTAATPSPHRHGYTCEQAEYEIDLQMQSKLEAQQSLRLICEAIDQPLDKLADGWRNSLPIILARIETIVDEAERAFRERDRARQALDFIVTDGTITPEGCPEPWRSTLIEWVQAAKAGMSRV